MSGGTPSSGGVAVSAKGKNVEFAKEVLMTYLEENDRAKALLGSTNALKDAPDPEKPRAKSFQAYVDSIPDFKSTTKYEWSLNNQELIVTLEDSSELLLTGTYTPEKFIEDLNASIAEIVG